MFGKAFGLIAVAKAPQARKMIAVERLRRADGEADAMQRQRVGLAQKAQLRMRDAARAHVVLGMDFEKAERLALRRDGGEMLRLEADAGAGRKARGRTIMASGHLAILATLRVREAPGAPLSRIFGICGIFRI